MQDKPSFIHNLFSRIAGRYDFLNNVMTGFMHGAWKRELVKHASAGVLDPGSVVLDLCTGTADIANIWIDNSNVDKVVAVDSCAPMLEVGYQKLSKERKGPPAKLEMIVADAMQLPFEDNSFDAITVGFGLRNTANPDIAIKEVFRVLKPGGFFASLDLGHPSIPLVNMIYRNIFLKLIPMLGSMLAGDKDAYQYLIDSLDTWPSQQNLSKAMYEFGFDRSYYKDIMLGSMAIVAAQK